jgi:hypothetical protein
LLASISQQHSLNRCVLTPKYTTGSIEVDARAEESTRETEEKLDGKSKEGHEREEPARRAVGR